MGFTKEAKQEKLQAHYGCDDLEVPSTTICSSLAATSVFSPTRATTACRTYSASLGPRVDKDIGNVEGHMLPEPTLAGYRFPDPLDARFFAGIPAKIEQFPDRFRVFQIGFSLYERAWTCGAWRT